MAISRASIISGPGSLTYNTTLKLFAQDQMSADVELDTWRPSLATFGGAGAPRLRDARGKIVITPTGNITAAMIAALWPTALRNPTIGASMHGAADIPAVLHSVAGKTVTFPNVALAGMPDMILTPQQTAIGQVNFNALIANSTERTATGAMYTTGTGAWSETLTESEIAAVNYVGVWNSVTFYTQAGWRVTFDLQLNPVYVDGIGTIDYHVAGLTVRASCIPVNVTEADMLSYLRPEGLALGASMRMTKNLVITGGSGGLTVTLYDAVLVRGPAKWGKTELRHGEIGFEASRDTTTGAVFALSITA